MRLSPVCGKALTSESISSDPRLQREHLAPLCQSPCGGLAPGQPPLLAAEILAGQLVGIRVEPATLMFHDPASRVLPRTRPNPLTGEQVARLRSTRPAGPPPRPPSEPIRVQRRAFATGVIVVCGQLPLRTASAARDVRSRRGA